MHTWCQKNMVREEVKIGRTSTTFDFLKYVLGPRRPLGMSLEPPRNL